METTVTGVFASVAQAQRAMRALEAAGFPADTIEVITRETADRHRLIAEETSDWAHGAWIGAAVGCAGTALAGIALSVPPVDLFAVDPVLAALLAGTLGAVVGGLIGVLVGSATGHQVRDEYEHKIDDGAVLLAVNTDSGRGPRAHGVLAHAGGTLLSSSAHRRHRGHARHSA